MKKHTILKIVNILLAINFVVLVKSTIFMEVLETSSWQHAAHELHEVSGGIFILLVFVHVGLNWNWVKTTFFLKKSKAPKTL